MALQSNTPTSEVCHDPAFLPGVRSAAGVPGLEDTRGCCFDVYRSGPNLEVSFLRVSQHPETIRRPEREGDEGTDVARSLPVTKDKRTWTCRMGVMLTVTPGPFPVGCKPSHRSSTLTHITM